MHATRAESSLAERLGRRTERPTRGGNCAHRFGVASGENRVWTVSICRSVCLFVPPSHPGGDHAVPGHLRASCAWRLRCVCVASVSDGETPLRFMSYGYSETRVTPRDDCLTAKVGACSPSERDGRHREIGAST